MTNPHNPARLAAHYSHFRVAERLLFTGHSHQAWPDVGLEAQRRAWVDAAELLDTKWDAAFGQADLVRRGFRRLLGDPKADLALAGNTHELVVRFLSALSLMERPRLVTTDGEFHSVRRQLDRLAEEGVDIVKVSSTPGTEVAQRLVDAIDDRTAGVLVSSVLFKTAHIVPDLSAVAQACDRVGAELLVDAYHHLSVVPFSVSEAGLDQAFIVGGGYKYCELGEGNCFLRVPPQCTLRPIITGWYSEFSAIQGKAEGVAYGVGNDLFAGATYDPTSHYRGAAVFRFFEEQGLDGATLRNISQAQVGRLIQAFDTLDLDPSTVSRDHDVELSGIAGFLALVSPHALELSRRLLARGVATDSRESSLRFGPAPYVTDQQIDEAMAILGEVVVGL